MFCLPVDQGWVTLAAFPRSRVAGEGVSVGAAKLNDYRRLCWAHEEPGLPLHFPHVLVSPMHLNMLTEPEFPFSLLGAVHLRNHVIRYRVTEPEEPLQLNSAIQSCRFRPQGYEIDLDTELIGEGGVVWSERTTFLVRKKLTKHDPESPLVSVFEGDDHEEAELLRFVVPKNAGKDFARITGDYNPIHVSRWLARLFGFKRDLVHGMWGLARATSGLEELENGKPVRVDVAFKGPLFMEHEVTVLVSDTKDGRRLRLFCGEEPRPAAIVMVRNCAARARVQETS